MAEKMEKLVNAKPGTNHSTNPTNPTNRTNPTTKYRCEFINLNCIFTNFMHCAKRIGLRDTLAVAVTAIKVYYKHIFCYYHTFSSIAHIFIACNNNRTVTAAFTTTYIYLPSKNWNINNVPPSFSWNAWCLNTEHFERLKLI